MVFLLKGKSHLWKFVFLFPVLETGFQNNYFDLPFFLRAFNPKKLKVTSRMFGTYVWQRSTSQYIAYCPEVLELLICPPLEVHQAKLLALPFSCMHNPNSMLDI
jgi:hypothetical protein